MRKKAIDLKVSISHYSPFFVLVYCFFLLNVVKGFFTETVSSWVFYRFDLPIGVLWLSLR